MKIEKQLPWLALLAIVNSGMAARADVVGTFVSGGFVSSTFKGVAGQSSIGASADGSQQRGLLFAADTFKPAVVISNPTVNQKISFGNFTGNALSGTASDNLGVSAVKVRLSRKRGTQNYYWNGTDFTTTPVWRDASVTTAGEQDVTWTLNGQLPAGDDLDAGLYQIEAYAIDAAGNKSTTQSRPFTLYSDSTAPSVTISTPSINQKIVIDDFTGTTISGTATDDVIVSAVRVRLGRKRGNTNYYWNGTNFLPSQATVAATLNGTNWTLGDNAPPTSKLDAGAYVVEVDAIDGAGNKSVRISRPFTLLADVSAPTITLDSPSNNQKIAISDFSGNLISGTASDNKAVTAVRVRLGRKRGNVNYYWNGTDFVTTNTLLDAARTGTSTVTWDLSNQTFPAEKLDQGTYQVEVYALDGSNNKSASIVRPFVLGNDFTAPSVAIITPISGQSIDINAFGSGTISGTVSDNVAVTSVKVKLQRKRGTVTQYWNGTTWATTAATVDAAFDTGTGSWTLDGAIPASELDNGVYTVYATAYDAAGNLATTSGRSFTITGSAADATSLDAQSKSAGGS